MRKLFLSFFTIAAISISVQAQELVRYSWPSLGISELVPVGADILESTSDVFEVDSEEFNIRIEAWDGSDASGDDLFALLEEGAEQAGISYTTDFNTFTTKTSEGIYVKGYDSHGNLVYFGLIGSNSSDLLVTMRIVYGEGNDSTAIKILKSVEFK